MEKRILVHYGLFSLNNNYWKLNVDDRKQTLRKFLKDAQEASQKTWFYQVYPAQTKFDILVWSTVECEEPDAPKKFMEALAQATNPYREYITPAENFWGVTKPSIYSRAKRSAQELDPFEESRKPYFIVYPFTKTATWYMKTREERQEMMNSHIKIGKSFPDITQLLLYSFGLQDQEFIVSYETDLLPQFSDLVYELRMTEARIFTLSDTPIITSFLQTPDALVKLFSGK
jgi:chlorite dismutase